MSEESKVLANSVKAAADHDGQTVDLPESVETAEDFVSWARSRPALYVSNADLEHARSHPNRLVKASVNPRVIDDDEPVALYEESRPAHDLVITDDMVGAVCKTLRERKGIRDIAMAGYVVNAVQSEVRKIKPLEAVSYTRDDLANAVSKNIPGYHATMGTLGMPKKVELAAYHLFMSGDMTSDDAQIIRAAARDLDKKGVLKFSDEC